MSRRRHPWSRKNLRRAATSLGAGCVVFLLGSFGFEKSAKADADLDAVLAQEVVTTASQTAETKASAPATTSVITSEDIQRHGIRTMNEALNFLSLGMFTTQRTPATEAGARGVLLTIDYGNHILLLIDGHAVNDPYSGAASFDRGLGVPIELIDHIEVILGPGAVLYGSNAMLGVVNVVTKKGEDYRGVRIIADSELSTWGKLGVGGGTSTSLFGHQLQISAAAEYQHLDGPRFDFAPQNHGLDSVTGEPKRYSSVGPGTGVWGGSIRPTARVPSAYVRMVSGNLDVALRAASWERSAPWIENVINAYGDFGRKGNYELERWFSADIKYRIPVSTIFDLRTRVYGDIYNYDWYNRTSAAEDCFDGQANGCQRDLRARSNWFGGELVLAHPTSPVTSIPATFASVSTASRSRRRGRGSRSTPARASTLRKDIRVLSLRVRWRG